jgi:hypothetical protein
MLATLLVVDHELSDYSESMTATVRLIDKLTAKPVIRPYDCLGTVSRSRLVVPDHARTAGSQALLSLTDWPLDVY